VRAVWPSPFAPRKPGKEPFRAEWVRVSICLFLAHALPCGTVSDACATMSLARRDEGRSMGHDSWCYRGYETYDTQWEQSMWEMGGITGLQIGDVVLAELSVRRIARHSPYSRYSACGDGRTTQAKTDRRWTQEQL